MLTQETITFLKRLDRNNNREWLQSHKPDFEKAKDELKKKILPKKQEEALDKWVKDLRAKAKIEINQALVAADK